MRDILKPLALLLLAAAPALGADSASLQFTVPAPDPVQAGETVVFQALAVNTGTEQWPAGSYYWVADVYDLDYNFLARTEQESPPEDIPPGGVAAISLKFPVPAVMLGRKLYRIFLVRNARTLLESEYKPFQVVEKIIPPVPEAEDYRLEGNVTLSYKNNSRKKWKDHSGATAINLVGKIKESSYLLNAHLLHEAGKVVDPFIILFTFYAPWGRVYAGDLSPTLSQLSVNGQGIRGLMLEQGKGSWEWTVLGGQSVTSQPGTATSNGRFARTLYGGKVTRQMLESVKVTANYFLSGDESGSLSSDPKSANFRGPTLTPQKNSGMGLGVGWLAGWGVQLNLDYQQNQFFKDSTKGGAKDTAWRGEVRWDRKLFKLRTYVQRAGPNFVAFGAPSIVGDRFTQDVNLGLFPWTWWSLSLGTNQYKDNLAGDPKRVTTNQRVMNVGNSFNIAKTGTSLSQGMTLNTAVGTPSTALNNRTSTLSLGVAQSLRRHSVSLSLQTVQFRDMNRLAHDLDTQTFGFNSNWALPKSWMATLGLSRSQSSDRQDSSKRTSQSTSASLTVPLKPQWSGQFWGTMTQARNTSTTFPGDTSTTSLNSEFTWARTPQNTIAAGLGYNKATDKVSPIRGFKEVTASMRYSYSF